jgi:hypothetical protein
MRCALHHSLHIIGCYLQTRKDADTACAALNGSILHGSELRVCFGKAVPIPPQPVYPPPAHVQQLRARVASAAQHVARRVHGEHFWGKGEDEEEAMHRVMYSPIRCNYCCD